MIVSAIQMVSTTDLQANLARADELLRAAAQAGAELAVLPEYFCLLGHRDTDKLRIQEVPGAGTVQRFLAQTAAKLGLWIVGGTVPLTVPPGYPASADPTPHVYNSSLVYAPRRSVRGPL